LLSYVSGLTASVAKNVVTYREENGAFFSRSALKKVSKLGPKAFEQCAGFLRIPGGKNILDNTGVHPESYAAATTLLELTGFSLKDISAGNVADLKERVRTYGEAKAAEVCGVGTPTLRDIVVELLRPGRDLRDELPPPMLRSDVMDMNDLREGMELQGTVRNVIDFGVFVDIGVHQDGLVHISQICDRFIKHPSEVLKVGDVATVYVLGVDAEKKRISLTMKKAQGQQDRQGQREWQGQQGQQDRQDRQGQQSRQEQRDRQGQQSRQEQQSRQGQREWQGQQSRQEQRDRQGRQRRKAPEVWNGIRFDK